MNTVRDLSYRLNSPLVRVTWVVLSIITALSFVIPPFMVMASLAYLLMIFGIVHRREKIIHVRLMSTAIGLDFALVLILELQRSAVETAISMSLGLPEKMHILFSLMAVLMYTPVIYFGRKRYYNQASALQKSYHMKFGIIAFSLRTLGYIFMFSMIK
ncbi:MAG: hypothetical protein A2Z20_09200 [Bdellovibrionales bacterium RBG_16_40_8]|nr:MAG: hypothetical protein A2Z20_09200 [Bdellovibrionales bacterium RBG_16_40_8]